MKSGAPGCPGPRRVDEPDRVARDLFGDHHLPRQLLELQDIVPRQHAFERRPAGAGRLRHDANFFILGEVGDHHIEHEAIELGLRQRIGALELDRILRREHEERLVERVGPPGGGDVRLLHRFEQRRLRLRRRAVDLVGQDDLREDRPFHEPQTPAALLLVENLGAGDVGRHQVGRELNALEVEIEDVGQGLDEQRLRQAGHAGDEAMAAGKERNQHLLDDVVLSDDHLAELREDALASFGDALGADRYRIRESVHVVSTLGPLTIVPDDIGTAGATVGDVGARLSRAGARVSA